MDGPFLAFLQIVLINVVLSGDNAVVIAMAAGGLPDRLRARAVRWGTAGAIVLRLLLAAVAVRLLQLPLLQAAGGLMLAGIAVKLMLDGGRRNVKHAGTLRGAVRTIMLADFVMSLDNVLAVTALAKGDFVLTMAGIVLSIPLILWGSALMLRLIDRFPPLVYAGAALLGWAAGDMLAADRLAGPWLMGWSRMPAGMLPPIGAMSVLLPGLLNQWRKGKKERSSSRDEAETGRHRQGGGCG